MAELSTQDEKSSTKEKPEPSAGMTVEQLRAALQLRFGDLVGRMERRGILSLVAKEPKDDPAGKGVCLAADDVSVGEEVAAFLFAAGGRVDIEGMIGAKLYAQLVSRVEDMAESDDRAIVKAESRMPEDTEPDDVDECLLAYTIQAAAELSDRPLANSPEARKLLVEFVAAVRGWWGKTELDQKLSRYGQSLQLTPRDIGALAVYSLKEADD